MIPSQKELWDKKHGEGEHTQYREAPLPFTKEVEALFPPNASVLDLGCGVGGSDIYFAEHGHNVLAMDFSETVINQNRQYFTHQNLSFEVMDMTKGLPFGEAQFDIVFAHLSLHYFDDQTTRRVFDDIARVLKPEGLLCFACKSLNDVDFGDGEELEPNLFVSSTGHVRHFFSEAYARDLLTGRFEIENIKEAIEKYGSKESAFLQCVARKKR